jgi:hypothetical protein|tara:strand:- start:146 stop:1117 length:972 start_codon:yes stop_codon:yes gene_type:complete
MKIIELVLDEEQEGSGVEAISIVESPAIEEDFVALKKEEIKLAEVSKDKKLLMGALLVPNKPIFRKSEKEEYYIYFSKDTILKASQLYLKNGNQNNSTLEHQHSLNGLTLVESWIVESETQDKSRLYNMNVPVGTWMGTVKVNNDDVWNEYVKTNKVKGFSIEGYFADKMERPKESIKEDMSEEKIAEQLLSKIENIVKGEKVELALDGDAKTALKDVDKYLKILDDGEFTFDKLDREYDALSDKYGSLRASVISSRNFLKKIEKEIKDVMSKYESSAQDLGIKPDSIKPYMSLQEGLKLTSVYISGADRDLKPINKIIQKLT